MIRAMEQKDRQTYLRLSGQFYASEAVAHAVPEEHFQRTFAEMMRSNAYVLGYLLEEEGEAAGYALLARTFSAEAGGQVVWIEELYITPDFRGRGLGSAFLQYLEEHLPEGVTRLRLEIAPDNQGARSLYLRKGFTPLPYEQMVREL